MTRATMIWATEKVVAWMMPPKKMRIFPIRMEFRRPSGMPTMTTMMDMAVAASVYEDAMNGITSVPVGFWGTSAFDRGVRKGSVLRRACLPQ